MTSFILKDEGGYYMKNKIFKISFIIFITLSFIILLNFIPTFSLQSAHMSCLKGKHVNLYYEKHSDAAKDVFQLAENKAAILEHNFCLKDTHLNIYMYDSQTTFQQKKYGYIVALLNLDWYIGDNRGTNVLLTSPDAKCQMHDYQTIKQTVLHEMTHAYLSTINSHLSLWLSEGIATYLTNGQTFQKNILNQSPICTYQDIQTNNPLYFSKIGGYIYAPTYIQFLITNYGWDSVLELIRTEDYQKIFHKSMKDIYHEWYQFLYNT